MANLNLFIVINVENVAKYIYKSVTEFVLGFFEYKVKINCI